MVRHVKCLRRSETEEGVQGPSDRGDDSIYLEKLFAGGACEVFRVGGVAQWLGRRSLAGGLSLTFVGELSALGQLTRPSQPSIPSGSVNE